MKIKIEKAINDREQTIGWHLFVNGEWHETYATQKEVKEASKYLQKRTRTND